MRRNGHKASCPHDCPRCRALEEEQGPEWPADFRNPAATAARLGEERTFTRVVSHDPIADSIEAERRTALQERRARERERQLR